MVALGKSTQAHLGEESWAVLAARLPRNLPLLLQANPELLQANPEQ
jgi:hypothetical protein